MEKLNLYFDNNEKIDLHQKKIIFHYIPKDNILHDEIIFMAMPFSHNIKKFKFPKNLKELHIFNPNPNTSYEYNTQFVQSTVNDVFYESLPENLRILDMVESANVDITKIPKFIEKLKISSHILLKDIPNNITSMHLFHFDDFDYSELPKTIKKLTISVEFDINIQNLPEGIEKLKLDYIGLECFFPKIPSTVKTLTLAGYSKEDTLHLPLLKKLKIVYSMINLDFLPVSLEELYIDYRADDIDLNLFPQSLKFLTLRLCGGNITKNPDLTARITYIN